MRPVLKITLAKSSCARQLLAQDLPKICHLLPKTLSKVPRLWRPNSCPGSWARSWARFGHLAQLRNNLPKTCHLLPKTLYKVPRLWRPNSCPGSWARSWARFGHLAQLRNNFLLGINALPYGLRTTNKTIPSKRYDRARSMAYRFYKHLMCVYGRPVYALQHGGMN